MKGETIEAVSFAEQLQAKVSAVTGKRDVWEAKCEKLVLEVRCMPGLAERARSLRARMAELKEASKTKTSKTRAKRRAANMEVITEQAGTELAKHTARIVQLYCDLHQLKGKLKLLERRNNDDDLRYFMLSAECDLLKCQVASGGLCSQTMILQLANAFKDVNVSVDGLNFHGAHTQKAVRDTF